MPWRESAVSCIWSLTLKSTRIVSGDRGSSPLTRAGVCRAGNLLFSGSQIQDWKPFFSFDNLSSEAGKYATSRDPLLLDLTETLKETVQHNQEVLDGKATAMNRAMAALGGSRLLVAYGAPMGRLLPGCIRYKQTEPPECLFHFQESGLVGADRHQVHVRVRVKSPSAREPPRMTRVGFRHSCISRVMARPTGSGVVRTGLMQTQSDLRREITSSWTVGHSYAIPSPSASRMDSYSGCYP